MENIFKKLNLDIVLKNMDDYCYSELSKNRFRNLRYINNFSELSRVHKENEEVEYLLKNYPLEFNLKIYDYNDSLKKAKIESILSEKELFFILKTIRTIRIFKNKFNNIQQSEYKNFNYLNFYIEQIVDVHYLENFLDKIVDEDGYIKSSASIELLDIRTKIKNLKNKSDITLKNILKKNINKLSESIITKRNDRDVILVKPEYKNDFGGIIHDESASGNTFYVEPKENVIINNNIAIFKRKEKEEIIKILKNATSYVAENYIYLKDNLNHFSEIEFVFSKMNFSMSNKFTKPILINSQNIELHSMHNPLISKDKVVKNNIYLNNKGNSIVITGPNTGGKTVVLKTVGICVLLTHLGLYIPTSEGSKIGFFEKIFVDVGDDQSIEHNLSTFSSHMSNIIKIVNNVNYKSIILLDELCSGTDPSEGSAISMALLDYFKKRKVTVLCTTHYPEIKEYCFKSNYYINSSLEFDFENLKPTFKFISGLPGKSNAINISYKLGLNNDIIDNANLLMSETEKENNILIDKLSENISLYDDKIKYLNNKILELDNVYIELNKKLDEYNKYKNTIFNNLYSELNNDIKVKQEEILEIYTKAKNKINLKQHEYNEIIKNIESYKENIVEIQTKNKNNDNIEFKIYDEVKILKYNQRATILKIREDKLRVKMGTIKLDVFKNEVEFLEKEKEYKTLKVTKNVSTNITLSVNVIGKNTEEAIIEVERYLDKVLLQGYESFTIIHGLGSGILKKNIAEYLKNNKYISSFRSGNQSEGGLGVTIVEIK